MLACTAWKLPILPAELLARLRIGNRQVHQLLHAADHFRRNATGAHVERGLDRQAGAVTAGDERVGGHDDVVERCTR
jgi:hypothetical protein